MRYRTKVTVVTGGKEYQPGSILPADISDADLNFLKSKGFVTPTEALSASADDYDEDDPFDFREAEPEALKSPEEIRKIRSKKEVARYAASIGCDLGEDFEGKGLKDLQEEVIDFQEERMADIVGYEGEEDDIL